MAHCLMFSKSWIQRLSSWHKKGTWRKALCHSTKNHFKKSDWHWQNFISLGESFRLLKTHAHMPIYITGMWIWTSSSFVICPKVNGRHLADDILICISEHDWLLIPVSLKCVPMVSSKSSQRCFKQRIGAEQATSYYLNQWGHTLLMYISVTRPRFYVTTAGYVWLQYSDS